MPIGDWFKARDQARYTAMTPSGKDLPDGVWSKCASCKKIVYQGELAAELMVCPHCGEHFPVPARDRIAMLADEGSFTETDVTLTSLDPLSFTSVKPYKEAQARAKERTGMAEAVVTGLAAIEGTPIVFGVMDFRFIGGSMGSAVGEKVARAFELGIAERLPVVMVTASGGARMQEGMLSLMQMAKTAAAVRKHGDAGLPYISVLANPTSGGVTASFAMLGDVLLSEPGAFIGFAGPRVIEQTIGQKLPKGFQTAEFLLEHGMVDEVVPRAELRERLGLLLKYLKPRDTGRAPTGASAGEVAR